MIRPFQRHARRALRQAYEAGAIDFQQCVAYAQLSREDDLLNDLVEMEVNKRMGEAQTAREFDPERFAKFMQILLDVFRQVLEIIAGLRSSVP